MNVILRITALFSIVFIVSCTGQARLLKAFENAGDQAYVRFERTACFGTCPVYVVRISGNGKLTYKGKEFSQPKGEYEVQISPEEWRTLQEKIAIAKFFGMKAEYDEYMTDVPSAITEVYINDKRKKTVINRWEAPEDLIRLETYIDNLWQKYLKEQ
jgi:hypothetical protein